MNIALRLPQLVESHQLRSCINNVGLNNYFNSHFAHFKVSVFQMPLLSSQFLNMHRELRLAHLALGVMTMGYIWQEGEKNTPEVPLSFFYT